MRVQIVRIGKIARLRTPKKYKTSKLQRNVHIL